MGYNETRTVLFYVYNTGWQTIIYINFYGDGMILAIYFLRFSYLYFLNMEKTENGPNDHFGVILQKKGDGYFALTDEPCREVIKKSIS